MNQNNAILWLANGFWRRQVATSGGLEVLSMERVTNFYARFRDEATWK